MKSIYIITKSLWQIFLVFIEVFAVTSLLVYASQFLRPTQDGFDILERYITFIAAYEILVYIISTFLNDIRRDSLLALKTAFEHALLYCETSSEFIKANLVDKIAKQFDSGTFNHLDVRKEYENLLQYIEAKNEVAIKYALLNINHNYEMCDLQWKLTFLLRWFK
jgi:hypothetical protein